MISEPEQITVDATDLNVLDSAGIDKDDITSLIHAYADDLRARGPEITADQPCRLTQSEMDILQEGGASGVTDDGESSYARTRGIAVISFELEFRQMQKASLDGEGMAEVLGISPSRVRQRVNPSSPGLYAFKARQGKLLFPKWQISNNERIPHLVDLVRTLSPDAHPISVHRFMTSVNTDLESTALNRCLTPSEWLVTGHPAQPVLDLARDL